jgi:hypothetical protein
MKRLPAIALLTLAVAGCATQWPDPRAIEPTRPRVFVTADNLLVVNQDPIIVPKENRTVVWQLPRDGKARFNREAGVTIDNVDKLLNPDGSAMKNSDRVAAVNAELKRRAASRTSLVPCKMENEYEFACMFPTDLPKGLYAYTIRVTIDGKLVELDPRVMPN